MTWVNGKRKKGRRTIRPAWPCRGAIDGVALARPRGRTGRSVDLQRRRCVHHRRVRSGRLRHQPLPGRPGILCAIQKLIDNPPCEGETGPKLGLKLAKLLRLLGRADDVANPRPVAQRALRLRTNTEAQAERVARRDKLSPS